MDVRVILLLMISAHAAFTADTSNGTNPRSFGVFRQMEPITYEPIDYPFSDEEIGSSRAKQGGIGRRARLGTFCNSSAQSSEHCNKTPAVVTLYVSEQTKTFLTGPLATRFIPIVYGLVFVCSVPLNAVAFLAFSCRIRRKKPVVVYMSQLALADLLFGLLLPLKMHYYFHGSDWVFGEAVCRVVTAAFYGYMNCSVLLVMCISIDRMLAVAFPVSSLRWRKPQKAVLACAGAWLLALVGAMPLLTIQQTLKIKQIGITCHDVLDSEDPRYLQLFSSISCLIYFLPLVITMTCYGIIIHALRGRKSLQGAVESSALSRKRRRRAAFMVVAVVVEFVVCFAPTNMILLMHCVLLMMNGKADRGDWSYTAYMVAVCVGSVSTCLDPLIYYFGSSQCRQQISTILCWRKGNAVPLTNSSTTLGNCKYKPYSTHTGKPTTGGRSLCAHEEVDC